MIFDQQYSTDFNFFTAFVSAPEEESDPKQFGIHSAGCFQSVRECTNALQECDLNT